MAAFDMILELIKNVKIVIMRKMEKKKMTQDTLSAKLQLSGCDIFFFVVFFLEVGQRHVYPDEIKLIKEILNTTYDELFDF